MQKHNRYSFMREATIAAMNGLLSSNSTIKKENIPGEAVRIAKATMDEFKKLTEELNIHED